MLIKVCGMRDPENIRAVEALGIDIMGFIFWERSPRCVASPQPPAGRKLKKAGVFVDESLPTVVRKARDFGLDYIQLHGSEPASYIDQLRKATDAQIIKAISIREADDVKRWREYEGHADMLLFDTKCKCVGGSGEQFDWSVLEQYDGPMPFLLSGGIGPEDAERITAFHHPRCIGIDLNSRFEDAPGVKNVEKLRDFIRIVKQ